jgi:hypothetical protein
MESAMECRPTQADKIRARWINLLERKLFNFMVLYRFVSLDFDSAPASASAYPAPTLLLPIRQDDLSSHSNPKTVFI